MGNICITGICSTVCQPKWSKYDNKTEELSFKGQKLKCKVVSVYDGDTMRVVFPLNGKMYKWNCRLLGIDTPELRTRNKREKELAIMAKENLIKLVFNKIIHIHCGGWDKYGRLLVTPITKEEGNICGWLVKHKYAKSYDGGKKSSWKK